MGRNAGNSNSYRTPEVCGDGWWRFAVCLIIDFIIKKFTFELTYGIILYFCGLIFKKPLYEKSNIKNH